MRRPLARTIPFVILALTFGLGLLAADGVRKIANGAGGAGVVKEPAFIYTHNEGRKLAVETSRELVKIPSDYGEPFAVDTVNGQTVVWYRSDELGVRNVVLLSDRDLFHLLPRESLTPKSESTSSRR